MNTLKKPALYLLGTVTFGFVLFSIATIGITILSISLILMIIGFLAQPLLPKMPLGPIIIEVTKTHETTQKV